MTRQDLVEEAERLLEEQAQLLIAVATGGPRIDGVNREYTTRRSRLTKVLPKLGLEDPFPWTDLWRWYAEWSSTLGTYAERRIRVRELLDEVMARLDRLRSGGDVQDWGDSGNDASWSGLERRLHEAREELVKAHSLDDLQDVGRRCREILIDAANLVFDEDMVPEDEDIPGRNDSKARIGYFLDYAASDSSRKGLRKLVRAAYDLMQTVTHSGSVSEVEAFAGAQSTVLIVRVLQKLEDSLTDG